MQKMKHFANIRKTCCIQDALVIKYNKNGRLGGASKCAVIGDFMRDDFYRRAFGGNKSAGYDSRFDRKSGNKNAGFGTKGGKEPEWENDITDTEKKRAKRVFSTVGTSLFVFSAISYAIISITYLVLFLFFREDLERLAADVYFTWAMNFVSMYIIAFPALCFVIRRIKPSAKRKKSRLGIDEFLLLFLSAEGVMMLGNLIGINFNNLLSMLIGKEISNDVTALISNSPIWLVILVAVIIGPIVEEIIFRKLLIDRLSVFGDLTAVIISAVLFGLFHGNFYQLFYAAGLGLILGYIYVKTGNLLYPTLMHMLINLLGSAAALPLTDTLLEFERLTEAMALGGTVDYSRLIILVNVIFAYVAVEYGMAIAGIVILVKKFRSHSIYLSNRAEISLSPKKTAKMAFSSVGMILFLAITAVQIIINIFTA